MQTEIERLHVHSGTHICMCLSMPLLIYTSVYLHVFMYVLQGFPVLYLGRVSSSLSSITRGKWNTFVSDCCMVRGGQINVFN